MDARGKFGRALDRRMPSMDHHESWLTINKFCRNKFDDVTFQACYQYHVICDINPSVRSDAVRLQTIFLKQQFSDKQVFREKKGYSIVASSCVTSRHLCCVFKVSTSLYKLESFFIVFVKRDSVSSLLNSPGQYHNTNITIFPSPKVLKP